MPKLWTGRDLGRRGAAPLMPPRWLRVLPSARVVWSAGLPVGYGLTGFGGGLGIQDSGSDGNTAAGPCGGATSGAIQVARPPLFMLVESKTSASESGGHRYPCAQVIRERAVFRCWPPRFRCTVVSMYKVSVRPTRRGPGYSYNWCSHTPRLPLGGSAGRYPPAARSRSTAKVAVVKGGPTSNGSELRQTSWPSDSILQRLPGELCSPTPRQRRRSGDLVVNRGQADPIVGDRTPSMSPSSEQSPAKPRQRWCHEHS